MKAPTKNEADEERSHRKGSDLPLPDVRVGLGIGAQVGNARSENNHEHAEDEQFL